MHTYIFIYAPVSIISREPALEIQLLYGSIVKGSRDDVDHVVREP
jgi:hypothetical protein